MRKIVEKYPAYLASLIAFIIYLFTLAPSVIQIDSGELTAVQSTLGIAHPTGYPLFTMLGYLWLHIPLPILKMVMANLFSTLWCALSVFLFVKALTIALDKPVIKTKKVVKDKNPNESITTEDRLLKSISALLGGLFLALSKTFWFQSTSIEVYSLHLFLIGGLFYLLVRIIFNNDNDAKKNWFVLSILLALGFSNHLTTILIIPGVAFVFFRMQKFAKTSLILLGKMLLIFFSILIVMYSYLPIRASFEPLLNWGNPDNWERFLRHFSGAQYRTWIFSSFDSTEKQLSYFINNLPNEFTVIGLLLIATGFFFSFKHSKNYFFFLLINTLITIGYSINYDISDIDSYFLLAYVNFSAAVPFAFYSLLLRCKQNRIRIAVLSCIVLFSVYIGWNNYSSVNQSNNYIYEDYTKSLIGSVDSNSVILSYQWDFFISASYYFQYVENYRKDVVIIDKELLRRSWYYDQLKNNHSNVIVGISNEVNCFLTALKPFEEGNNFNPQTLEYYYQVIMTGLVSNNIPNKSFYIGIELAQNEMRNGSFKLPEGYSIIPDLFLFRVVKGNEYIESPLPNFNLRFTDVENHYTTFIKTSVYNMLTFRGLYELSYNKIDRAKIFAKKIQEMFPNYQLKQELKSIL